MSECFERIHRAIQSHDDGELRSYVSGLAHTTRQNGQTVECIIIDLKLAVDALPASSLRELGRRELRDSVVRMAIDAYYDATDSFAPPLGWR
jgi:hypothetical protein